MPHTEHKLKPKRRWLTYSLRSFFLIVTVGCVTFGFWAHWLAKQKAIVEWVKEQGGVCYYEFELNEKRNVITTPKRPGPHLAQTLLGDDYFANVVAVDIHFTNLKDIKPSSGLRPA